MGSSCTKGNRETDYLTPRTNSEHRGFRAGLVQKRSGTSIWNSYDCVKEIGHGMTGKVYLIRHRATQDEFALKCMEMSKLDPALLGDLRNEIEILQLLDHPNVIKLFEYFEDEENLYLILEYCSGGELFDHLHSQQGCHYSEAQAARIIRMLLRAVAYCHHKGISHRDLKFVTIRPVFDGVSCLDRLENFIFDRSGEMANLKLIDFGLSRKYVASMRRMSTLVGTPYYMAPEVLIGREEGYTQACDLWSVGVITYMLLSGTPPFGGHNDYQVLANVRRGVYSMSGRCWEGISEEAKDFIRRLLKAKPAKRLNADEALRHAWFRKMDQANSTATLDPSILASLRSFSRFSALKRAALEVIAFTMNAIEIEHLQKAFVAIDTHNTGTLSISDMEEVLRREGLLKDEIERIFQVMDQHNSHEVSYSEWLAASLDRRLYLSRERAQEAFRRLDIDNTGTITPGNLRKVLGDDFSEEKVAEMIHDADKKGIGAIDFESFWELVVAEEDERVSNIAPNGFARFIAGGADFRGKIGPLEYTDSAIRIAEETKCASRTRPATATATAIAAEAAVATV